MGGILVQPEILTSLASPWAITPIAETTHGRGVVQESWLGSPKSSRIHKMLSSFEFNMLQTKNSRKMIYSILHICPSFSHGFFSPSRPILPMCNATSLACGSEGCRAPHSSGHSSSFSMERRATARAQTLELRDTVTRELRWILLALNDYFRLLIQ